MRLSAILVLLLGIVCYATGSQLLARGIVAGMVGGVAPGSKVGGPLMFAGLSATAIAIILAFLDARRRRSSLVLLGLALAVGATQWWLLK